MAGKGEATSSFGLAGWEQGIASPDFHFCLCNYPA
jgi:hypothetical protein